MYVGLREPKFQTFPIHAVISVISDSIKKDWQEPENKTFFSQEPIRDVFRFEEDPSAVWNKVPRLDSAFSQVSRSTDLAFEEMGVLRDPMDKRMDLLLKRSWQLVMSNLKPPMATTCVASNL